MGMQQRQACALVLEHRWSIACCTYELDDQQFRLRSSETLPAHSGFAVEASEATVRITACCLYLVQAQLFEPCMQTVISMRRLSAMMSVINNSASRMSQMRFDTSR